MEVRIPIQGNSLGVIGLGADLEETFFGVESWRQLLCWVLFDHDRVELFGIVVLVLLVWMHNH